MKKVKTKDLEIGKLYADTKFIGDSTITIMRYLGVRDGSRIFEYVSGFKYSSMTNGEIIFGLDLLASFWEVEESLIQTMQSDINSFFAIIDITVAKLKATASEIENLKQKP